VSGGADSVALLDVLKRGGYDCVVAHCNFHLRGEESDRDEAFVRRMCEGLPLYVRDFDTRAYAADTHQSIEMAARELRYQWFQELASSLDCEAIAVAHHQHDQAETLLLNLKRGAGLRGMCGMRAKHEVVDGVPVIRPLLCTTRDYIEHYLRDIRGLDWVDDSTNSDVSIPRNAIRALLKSFTKSEIEHMASTAEYMQGYLDWIEGKDSIAAQRVQLYEQLREYGFAEIDKIYNALKKGVGGKIFRSATHEATIKHKKLTIRTIEE
jgi:tRNA(Ile)-lysidine synthase